MKNFVFLNQIFGMMRKTKSKQTSFWRKYEKHASTEIFMYVIIVFIILFGILIFM